MFQLKTVSHPDLPAYYMLCTICVCRKKCSLCLEWEDIRQCAVQMKACLSIVWKEGFLRLNQFMGKLFFPQDRGPVETQGFRLDALSSWAFKVTATPLHYTTTYSNWHNTNIFPLLFPPLLFIKTYFLKVPYILYVSLAASTVKKL